MRSPRRAAATSSPRSLRHRHAGFAGAAALAPRAAAIPDVDHPRGRQEALVSDADAGAASQPAVASSRDHDLLVAAYRVFADPARLREPDRHRGLVRPRRALGCARRVSDASPRTPRSAFDAAGDALLLTNEAGAVVLRRWSRPPARLVRDRDVGGAARLPRPAGRRRRAPRARRRPRDVARLLGPHDRPRCLRPPGRAVPALGRPRRDLGRARSRSRRRGARRPYGPYVGGVAVAGRRGEFSVAWVDTSRRSRLRSRLGVGRARSSPAPVRVARFARFPSASRATASATSPCSRSRPAGRALPRLRRRCRRPGGLQLVRSVRHALAGRRSTSARSASGADQFQPSVARGGPRRPRLASSTAAWTRPARSPTSGSRPRTTAAPRGARSGSRTTPGPGDRRAALADRRSARRSPGAGRRPLRGRRARRRPASRELVVARPRLRPRPGGTPPRSCSPGPFATGGAISVRGVSTGSDPGTRRPDHGAARLVLPRRRRRWRTPSTTRSRTSCGR